MNRWKKFKRNKLGFASFVILMIIFTICLFAEFAANDKPLIIKYKNHYYFPIVFNYIETDFGGDFETSPNFKDPYLQNIINSSGWMVFPPIKYNHNSIKYNSVSPPPSPPNQDNFFGTDDNGQDILANIIYGVRISILFGLLLTIFSMVIGAVIGGMSGYYAGRFDILTQRFIEIWSSLPILFILIIISSIIVPSFLSILFILLLFSWMSICGLVRAEFLKVKNLYFVMSAKAMGLSDTRIIFRHILPNAITSIVTFLPFTMVASISTLATLDFLGFGMPIGSPSLGVILLEAKANIDAPWIGLSAFFVMFALLSLFIFIGESLRDAFSES